MTTMADEVVDLKDITVVRETNAAICIRKDGVEHWLPFSQVESVHRNGAKSWLVVKSWIAKKKGLC